MSGPYPSFQPVHQENGKWYFWIETWADRIGPFDSREEAQSELVRYSISELGYDYETDEAESRADS